MTILSRYIIYEMLKYVAVVILAVVGIYLTVDFIEKVDDYLEAGASVYRTFVYLGYKIPFILAQIMPVGVLLSVLITFGLMSKNNELLAMRSSGLSSMTLLRPTLKFALLIALILVFLSELFAPFAALQTNRIWLTEVKKENLAATDEQDIWLKTDRAIVNFRYYHLATNKAQGISMNLFDERFRLIRRLDAATGRFAGGAWHLNQVVEQLWEPDRQRYKVNVYDTYELSNVALTPEDFETVARQSNEMSFYELLAYIREVEADGYDATASRVDLHGKVAYPFTCLVMGILGLGVAARGRVREGMVAGIVIGIAIVFVYWIFYSFCTSLGYGGVLKPIVAAWLANIVFTCMGWFLFSYAH